MGLSGPEWYCTTFFSTFFSTEIGSTVVKAQPSSTSRPLRSACLRAYASNPLRCKPFRRHSRQSSLHHFPSRKDWDGRRWIARPLPTIVPPRPRARKNSNHFSECIALAALCTYHSVNPQIAGDEPALRWVACMLRARDGCMRGECRHGAGITDNTQAGRDRVVFDAAATIPRHVRW